MTETVKTISPVDGRIYVERPLETAAGIDRALDSAQRAQAAWAALPLATRCEILTKAVDAFVAKTNDIAAEITWQMGRPIRYTPGEVRGFEERARYMLNAAPLALAAIRPGEKAGFNRQIKRVPLGVIVVVAPWNYPYLTAVNAVIPALMSPVVVSRLQIGTARALYATAVVGSVCGTSPEIAPNPPLKSQANCVESPN